MRLKIISVDFRSLRSQSQEPRGDYCLCFAGILRSVFHALRYFPAYQVKRFMPRTACLDQSRECLRGGTKTPGKVIFDDNMKNRMTADFAAQSFCGVEVRRQAHTLLL